VRDCRPCCCRRSHALFAWALRASRNASRDLHQCDASHDAAGSANEVEYLLNRAARLRDLATRARNPEHKRYLVRHAAEVACLAETLEWVAKAKPVEAGLDAGLPPRADKG
jgi:hypothetical protein